MKYNELPKWAQKTVKQRAKNWFLMDANDARQAGENVPYYTDEQLEFVTMQYLNGKDDFDIDYDEETGVESVSF